MNLKKANALEQRVLETFAKMQAARDARKATGPTTEEGKARSSRNAIKHGLYSKRVVLATESQEEYDELRADYHRDLQPVNRVERDLVDEIANCRWRLLRIAAIETATLDAAFQLTPAGLLTPDPLARLATAHRGLDQAPERYRRLETSLARQYHRALRDLRALQQERRAQSPQPAQPEAQTAPAQPPVPPPVQPPTSSFQQVTVDTTTPQARRAPQSAQVPEPTLEKAA